MGYGVRHGTCAGEVPTHAAAALAACAPVGALRWGTVPGQHAWHADGLTQSLSRTSGRPPGGLLDVKQQHASSAAATPGCTRPVGRVTSGHDQAAPC